MPLTRAVVEAELIDRCGARLARVQKDATTANGSNASLAGPIADALRALGYEPGSPVADADLEAVPAKQHARLLDTAEYFTLWRILNNWAEVDYTNGATASSMSQFADQVREALTLLEARMLKQYGPLGVSALGAASGVMTSGRDPGGGGLRQCWPGAYESEWPYGYGYPGRLP